MALGQKGNTMATVTPPPPKVSASVVFAGIGKAKMRVDANYERDGHYYLRIDGIKLDKNRKEEVFMAIEKTVLKVVSVEPGMNPHKVGEAVCHMMMLKHDSFLGNVKAMIAHVLNIQPEQITEEDAVKICSVDQPLTGFIIECQNRTIMTKAGKPFTVINYKRALTPAETLVALDPVVVANFFPNQILEQLAAAEAPAAA